MNLAGSDSAGFDLWKPANDLEKRQQFDVKYSRGFLRAEPALLFPSLPEHWAPMLHLLSVEVSKFETKTLAGFPESLYWAAPIEISGEAGVIGVEKDSFRQLKNCVAQGVGEEGGEIAFEYLIRRLLSTLEKSWHSDENIKFHYLAQPVESFSSLVGSVRIDFDLRGERVAILLGLGMNNVEAFDKLWRRLLVEQAQSSTVEARDDIVTIGIELGEILVEPVKLIDYMRADTIIDLELPVSTEVLIRVDEQPWAMGTLQQCRGLYSVRVEHFNPRPETFSQGTTKLRAEISRFDIDVESFMEYGQKDAELLTDTRVGSPASLLISGENVALATIGIRDSRFALQVLPKK